MDPEAADDAADLEMVPAEAHRGLGGRILFSDFRSWMVSMGTGFKKEMIPITVAIPETFEQTQTYFLVRDLARGLYAEVTGKAMERWVDKEIDIQDHGCFRVCFLCLI